MKRILALTILSIACSFIFGQVNPKKCMTTNLVKEELKNNSEYELMRNSLINYHQANKAVNYKNQPTITIPVVVHVVHRTQDAIGANTNISNAQIEDQLRILNEDFSKTNPEFPNPPRNTFISYAGNPELEFCLATIDPNGNPTTGITRTATTKTGWDYNTESNDMKQASTGGIDNWAPLRYLNIWVCNISSSGSGGQTLGYAYLPGLQASNSQSWKDGLVVDYQYFGTTGSVSSSSDGRTTTHEIGHYLGLSHTFCESGGCCDNDDSNVDDTPATDGIYFGSVNTNTNNNSCNDLNYGFSNDLIDMDENYMAYSSNTWMFSNGQVTAMLNVLNASSWQGGRKDLWQNTTVTVDCSNIVASSWDCDAQGNCNDPGNGTGFYSSYSACVNACNCLAQPLPLSEGFQNSSSLPTNWSLINNDNDKTWEITSLAGYNSTSSIYMNNADYTSNGEVDDLVLSTLNLSSSSPVDLLFDYAYTLWTDPNSNPNFSDTLQILVSSDCGSTWQKIWEKSGVNLVTSNPVFTGAAWIPSNNNSWASESISLNNYINQQDFIIKFRNITDYENNLFLDNINITGTSIAQSWDCDEQGNCIDPGNGNGQYSTLSACNYVCVSTAIGEINNNLFIYPNPASNKININYRGLKEIYNVLGDKVIHTFENEINISSLSKGVYFLKAGDTNIRLIKN
jgi:hypothetical protein